MISIKNLRGLLGAKHMFNEFKFRACILSGLLLFSINGSAETNLLRSENFKLNVNFKEATPNDTLVLLLTSKYLTNLNSDGIERIESTQSKAGNYGFTANVKFKHGYWQLFKKTSSRTRSLLEITIPFFWEANDSLNLKLSNIGRAAGIYSTYAFSGRGMEKYECRYKLENHWKAARLEKLAKDPDSAFGVANRSLLIHMLKFIDQNSEGMSDLSNKILKEDLIYRQGRGIQSSFYLFLKNNKIEVMDPIRKSLIKRCKYVFSSRGLIQFDSVAMASSPNAIAFVVNGLVAESYILFNSPNGKWIYDQIKQQYSGELKDQLIAYQFVFLSRNDNKADSLYQNALATIKSIDARKQLLSVQSVYNKVSFPNFTLCDSIGGKFELSSLNGKVVLVDFWFTGCGYCKEFYKNILSRVEEEFKNDNNVKFVSISLDIQRDKWINSLMTNNYSGKNKVINLYTCGEGFGHAVVKGINLQACPTVLLIGKDNIVRYFNSTDLYEFESLVKAINKMKL